MKAEMKQEVKERPILFSGPMVKAILDDRKTQTRRVMNPQPKMMGTIYQFGKQVETWAWWNKKLDAGHAHTLLDSLINLITPLCPYGKPGDRLWVRESVSESKKRDHATGQLVHYRWNYRADEELKPVDGRFVQGQRSDGKAIRTMADLLKWTPSIHMPRVASRITLEITNVRVERLQDISDEDCKAEGLSCGAPDIFEFRNLWNKINGKKHSWESNPFVWVISFKKI